MSSILKITQVALLVLAVVGSVAISGPAAAQSRGISRQPGPFCRIVRMQVPANPGLEWKQVEECENSE